MPRICQREETLAVSTLLSFADRVHLNQLQCVQKETHLIPKVVSKISSSNFQEN